MGTTIGQNEPQQQTAGKQPWKVGTYTKTQVGVLNSPNGKFAGLNAMLYANQVLGVKAEKGNIFASAEVGAGTSEAAKVKAGYNIPIGENFGLELSADASATKDVVGLDVTAIGRRIDGDPFNGIGHYTENTVQAGLNRSYKSIGTNIMAKYKANDLTLKAGMRVSASTATTGIKIGLDGALNSSINTTQVGVPVSGIVVSPAAEVNWKRGKSELGLEGSLDEIKAYIGYNF